MKTPERKYIVTRHYDRDNLESVGYNRWVNKNIRWIIVYFGVFLATGLSLDTWTPKNSNWRSYFIIPFVAIFVWGLWKAYQNGKKLFNKVKDLPEPIDLDSIK